VKKNTNNNMKRKRKENINVSVKNVKQTKTSFANGVHAK